MRTGTPGYGRNSSVTVPNTSTLTIPVAVQIGIVTGAPNASVCQIPVATRNAIVADAPNASDETIPVNWPE